METLKRVLMTRDHLTEAEADEAIEIACKRVVEDGENIQDVLQEEFGLEPDYMFDLLNGKGW